MPAGVLMVGRTRYGFPLSSSVRRKFDALEEHLDLHVLATAQTRGDAATPEDDRFDLVAPHRPRPLDGPLFYAGLPFRVALRLRALDPEAVLAQSPYEGLAVLAARRLAKRHPRLVVEVHGDFRTATRLYGSRARRMLSPLADAAARLAVRRADRVRTVGPFTSAIVRACGVEPAASFPAFVDGETFAATPPAPLPRSPSFLFVGVLERYKNIDCLTEAWRRVARWEPSATLRIVGDGTERARVEELVQELPGRTTWDRRLPPEEISCALDASSALVLPSRSEGLPRIAIEALERGRPVLGARAGGIPDLVRDRVNGVLFDAESIPAIADAMLSVARDRQLLERLARAARSSADPFCLSPDDYARRVESLVA